MITAMTHKKELLFQLYVIRKAFFADVFSYFFNDIHDFLHA